VTSIKQQTSEGKKEASTSIGYANKAGEAKDNAECNHFFGYLKTRPKDVSIPDECLTCNKMIDCLVR
jgi:hypothetical protein